MSMPHICTIKHESSKTYLPYDPETKNPWHVFKRWWRSSIMVWRRHPLFSHYFRSDSAYLKERRRHATMKYNYIIHPLSKVNFVVQLTRLFVYPIFFIYFPLTTSFHNLLDLNNGDRKDFETILGIFLCGDIAIRCFVGRKNSRLREINLDQFKILRSYLCSPIFICDACGIIPVAHLARYDPDILVIYSLASLRVLKIFRIKAFIDCSHELLKMFGLSVYSGLSNFFLITGFIFHWASCFYYAIAIMRANLAGQEDKESVLSQYHINQTAILPRYIKNAFRSMGMLMNARRDVKVYMAFEQKMFCVCYLVVGKILILVLGVIFISQLMRNTGIITKYREVVGQLNEFMIHKELPVATQKRLLEFYDYKYQGRFVKEGTIHDVLSDRLKREITFHHSKKLVKQVEIFDDVPTKILSDVLNNLKKEVFLPNDIIIKAGSFADSLYFISNGTVCVTTASGREVCHLQDGGYFGEAALVLNHKKSISNVTALEICETYRLDSRTFLNCFKNNPELLSKLKTVAEEREKETMQLEQEFQEQLFLKTYVSDRKKSGVEMNEVKTEPE